MPHSSLFRMSPELEGEIFRLAREAFPKDKDLQEFKLSDRHRIKSLMN
jgi:hypothetical protein